MSRTHRPLRPRGFVVLETGKAILGAGLSAADAEADWRRNARDPSNKVARATLDRQRRGTSGPIRTLPATGAVLLGAVDGTLDPDGWAIALDADGAELVALRSEVRP